MRSILFAAVAVLIAAFVYNWLQADMSDSAKQVQEITDEMLNNFKSLQKSAFIVGYTGEIGKELTRAIVQSGIFKRVVLVGRRAVDYSNDTLLKDVEQAQVDFDKIDEHSAVFKDLDVGYCCLGTTRAKVGPEMFVKVDYDYVVNTARVAKDAGVKHYQLVSSVGSDEKSWFLYTKTKGRAEKALVALGFERLSIMRPGFLLCDRAESRTMEKVAMAVMSPLMSLAPTRFSVPTRTVGFAMLYRTLLPSNESVEFMENAKIHHLAAKAPGFGAAK